MKNNDIKLARIGRINIICCEPKTNPYWTLVDTDGFVVSIRSDTLKDAIIKALEYQKLIEYYHGSFL